MLTAGVDFLLPSFLLAVVLLLVKGGCLQQRITGVEWALAAAAILSYGAMILSPHYPDRATFSTMVFCITLVVSVMKDIIRKKPGTSLYFKGMAAGLWVCAMGRILIELNL